MYKHIFSHQWIIMAVLAVNLVSCTNSTGLPEIIGTLNEVLVVVDDPLWKGKAGQALQSFLSDTIISSNTIEPHFDVTQIPSAAFSSSTHRFRNILLVDVLTSATRSELSVVENKWSDPQIVVSIVAPSIDSLTAAIPRFGDRIVALFDAKERERLMDVYERGNNHEIEAYLSSAHQVSVHVPRLYTLDVATPEFVWMSRDEKLLTMGIFFWSYPYTDTTQLTLPALIQKRNEMTIAHVPGPIDSSYMVVEDWVEPIMQEFLYKGRYCIKINGLWKTERAFMGGPFESIIMVDEERGRILTLDGFVYYPQQPKRDYMTQLEAIMLSMKPVPLAEVEAEAEADGEDEKR